MEIEGTILVRGVNEPHSVISELITEIARDAFLDCTQLISVVLPSTLTTIGDSAFHGCTGLTHVTLPEGFTSIGDYAFANCTGLTSVVFPSTLTTIGGSAFRYTGLTSVDLSATKMTGIWREVFFHCTGLVRVKLPRSLTRILNSAFSHCERLVSVILPSNLTLIEQRAFYSCKSLSVLVPPCQVDASAFGLCEFVVNASRTNFAPRYLGPGKHARIIDVDPTIVGLRQQLLAIWAQNIPRQGRMRTVAKKNKLRLSESMMDYELLQSMRERTEVNKIWKEIKQSLEGITYRRRKKVERFLFSRIIEAGRFLVRMDSYLDQPDNTKVFKKVIEDLGIYEPRRSAESKVSQLRFN